MVDQGLLAYETLSQQITSWALPPGTHLVEAELAASIGVSRTPLRDALARLRGEGLVDQEPGRGAVVSPVTAEHAVAIYQARDALESYALRLAAESTRTAAFASFANEFGALASRAADAEAVASCSARFDAAVLNAADSPVIASLIAGLMGRVHRLRRLAATDSGRLQASCVQRQSVAIALEAGLGAAAVAANSARLRSSLDSVLHRLLSHLAPPEHGPTEPPLGRHSSSTTEP
ncbi:GntR family transcriptional regulator [Leifsonia sp. AG29]|uniref:GntR family transcriptional regulator n=1 Tax=Leifsonia sp. AG29 TaxID=2598860 RepID=UPI00131DE3DC|nr:GntR family transcriptional regulator [Leifsonia sp. AG29]